METFAVSGTGACNPDGCAQLCTEQGMAAAHAEYHARVITGNTAIDMVKARVRRPPLASGAVRENAPSASLGDIDLVILRSQLRHALSSLGAHHRDAVVETVLRDRPHAEVAAELGVAPGTLRTRVHYALRRLRSVLEAEAAAEAAPCCC